MFLELGTPFETVIALLIHLVPTYLVVGALILAWKRPVIGGLAFIGYALFFIYIMRNNFNIMAFLIMILPILTIGSLFILKNDRLRKKLKDRFARK
mgnify:CR=1 FL=1|tara:strand:+ start:4005 stop:4292 length:288 start_codon:yes stop_codon:yes gene_type:complete